jgi:thiol-disulfide isomerase/thioredoxin
MKKIIIVLLLISVKIFSQTETEMDFLNKLIADGSSVPAISGKLYKHNPKIKFKSVADFDKTLTNYKINFNKKITILVFWEKKDKYSKLLLPKLENIKKKYKKVQIITINTNDFDDKNELIDFFNDYNNTECVFQDDINKYYEKKDMKYFKPLTIPTLFADKKLKQSFGVTAFPATIIVTQNKKVYTAMIGYFNEYENWIKEVLDGIK